MFPLIYHSKAASPYQGATHHWNPPMSHQAATEEPARSHRGTHFWLHGPQGMLKKELKEQERAAMGRGTRDHEEDLPRPAASPRSPANLLPRNLLASCWPPAWSLKPMKNQYFCFSAAPYRIVFDLSRKSKKIM